MTPRMPLVSGNRTAPEDVTWDRTPISAAMQMALQPNLTSLDELLAAIRALQSQADQEMNRLLEQNKELLQALNRIAFDAFGEAGASNGEVLEAITWAARDAIANAGLKPNTRTDDDVADDRRSLIDELPDDPDYTGGGR